MDIQRDKIIPVFIDYSMSVIVSRVAGCVLRLEACAPARVARLNK